MNTNTLQLSLFKDKRSLTLFATSFIMIMGSQLVVSIIPEIMTAFQVNEGTAGLIISAYTFPTIILSPVIGKLANTYGRKVFMVSGTLLYGIAGMLPAVFNPGFQLALMFRVIQGIGFAAAMPLTVTLIGDFYEGDREVAAQGFRTFFIGLASIIFPVIGSGLAVLSWHYPFFCYLIAVPFAFFISAYLPDNEQIIEGKRNKVNLHELHLLRDPYLLMVLVAGFARFFLAFAVRAYLPILLIYKFESSLVLGGILVGTMAVTNSLASFQAGLVAAKIGRVNPVKIGFLVYIAGGFLLPFSPNIVIVFILTLIIGLGDGLLVPFQKSLVTQSVTRESRAAVVAINSSMQSLGKTISPLVGLISAGFGLNWAFWTMGLVALLTFLYFAVYGENYLKPGTVGADA